MRIFGFEISRAKAAQTMSAIGRVGGGWFNVVRESFGGAFQGDITIDSTRDILAFAGVFSPLTLIASDIAKLRIRLVEEDTDGICKPVERKSPYLAVLKRPNHFQNIIQFIEQWIISKLLHGNTFVLKERDNRGIVIRLYILDAQRVTPMVTETGDVYYKLSADHLSGLLDSVTVPASEIIHDRMNCLFHPLIGISPIYACGLSATMGRRIQSNSGKFFENMSRPSGMLTAPASIADETAIRLKAEWEANFSGANIGRLAVLGDGLKYEAMTIPAEQAQLIQQLEWTVKDIAACFHMPLYKVGGPVPANNNVEALGQQYYSDCLQSLIESAELCLDEGLKLPDGYYTEFNIEGLMRMDSVSQIDVLTKAVAGCIMVPNEARRRLNLPKKEGGDALYLQQQNYSLEALAKRDAKEDPFSTAKAPPPVAPAPNPAPSEEQAAKDLEYAAKTAEIIAIISKGTPCLM